MFYWQDLLNLSEPEIWQRGLAALNLACGHGLAGLERFDYRKCLKRLHQWAQWVQIGIDRTTANFAAAPGDYENSWAYFRALTMVTILQRNLGMRYNPEKLVHDATFTAEDVFLYGAVLGHGGTCASIPVVIAEVGRQLGFPIKLVKARSHLFVRWDDGKERFNIEATNRGLSCQPDDYYRRGRYCITPDQEKEGCFLQSMAPKEELAYFLTQRAHCFLDLGSHNEAAEALLWAAKLCPENRLAACAAAWCLEKVGGGGPPTFKSEVTASWRSFGRRTHEFSRVQHC